MRLEERSCNRKSIDVIDIRAVQEMLAFLERPEFLTLFVLYPTCRSWGFRRYESKTLICSSAFVFVCNLIRGGKGDETR